MHKMLNLNKFKNSYNFEKHSGLCLMKKKIQGFIRNVKIIFFWPKIFITNTLCPNVYKMYELDKNPMPYCNIKNFKKSNF